MKFQAQPTALARTVPPAGSAPVSAAPAPSSPTTPSVHIDRIEVEGCGPMSAAVREGFRDAWLRSDHQPTGWSARRASDFQSPLSLEIPPGLSGRELGRRVAEAILQRARQRASRE